MPAPAPVFRGQGNDRFRSERQNLILKRGQTVPYDVNGAPTSAAVADDSITNAKLANMVQATFKMRAAGAGTGDPIDGTGTQATALLDTFTSALKGVVPASGGGSVNFLRGDGSWASPFAGSSYSVVTKIAGYTETATSGELIILADLAAGFTIILPTAVGNTAKLTVKKMQAAGAIVLDGNGSQTIDGGLTATLNNQYEAVTLVSDNANWVII